MVTVGEIMTERLVTAAPDYSVARAAALMEHFRIGSLPVVEESGRLVGILTSRDVRCSHPNRLLADAMSKDVVTVPPDCSLWEAKEVLERHGIERVVVVDESGCPAGILTKTRLYAELGQHVDALTGLNRADFLHQKAFELLQEGREIAFIFLDLDDFREIDKQHGHVFGDKILKQVAQVLKGEVEEGIDQLCRYAGDEFAILTGRPMGDARKLAHRVVTALARNAWPQGVRVTGSAGVAGGRREATRPESDVRSTISTLINMASLASSQAKREKRPVVMAGWVDLREAR